ncbi:MAG: hypothetical protein RL761_723 [Pseudomonadota bacterium]|jgi:hypothetical protein
MIVETSETTASATDWSIAYAITIRRMDKRFMLSLLRLDSWPNLSAMHGDLVDSMKLVCALLDKRPMVGFLVARRLKLPVEKTYALLSVLQTKGHIVTLGAELVGHKVDLQDDVVDLQENSPMGDVKLSTMLGVGAAGNATSRGTSSVNDSGDVLNQLWRVLNTDISWSKSANASKDPNSAKDKDAGDVLGQLWRVLNTDIVLKTDVNNQPIAATEVEIKLHQAKVDEAAGVMRQLWSVLNTDIAFTRLAGSNVKEAGVEEKAKEVSTVLRQLWRVLNTEIANKRQLDSVDGSIAATDTTMEANDKLSKLWRILDTEITLKKKSKTYMMRSSTGHSLQVDVEDTSSDAVSRLSQLWQVLNSEIAVTVPPERHAMAVNTNKFHV